MEHAAEDTAKAGSLARNGPWLWVSGGPNGSPPPDMDHRTPQAGSPRARTDPLGPQQPHPRRGSYVSRGMDCLQLGPGLHKLFIDLQLGPLWPETAKRVQMPPPVDSNAQKQPNPPALFTIVWPSLKAQRPTKKVEGFWAWFPPPSDLPCSLGPGSRTARNGAKEAARGQRSCPGVGVRLGHFWHRRGG